MNGLNFVAFFLSQCGPLIGCALVGSAAWAVIKVLLRSRGCGARRYARQQTLWSNWS